MAKITLPPKKYYRLQDVAKLWDCSVDDLLDYAEQGILTICVKPLEGKLLATNPAMDEWHIDIHNIETGIVDGLFPIGRDLLGSVRYESGPFPFISWFKPSLKTYDGDLIEFIHGYYRKEQMYITAEELERFKNESQGIHNPPEEEQATMPEELAYAIKAWQALYRDKEINNKTSHIDQIKRWLNENNPSFSGEAKKRIAIVVNMRKKGGQLKIE